MCGRFTSTASPEELMRRFGVTVLDNLQPRWNVAPSQKALVVTRAGLQPEGALVAWGGAPHFVARRLLQTAGVQQIAEVGFPQNCKLSIEVQINQASRVVHQASRVVHVIARAS